VSVSAEATGLSPQSTYHFRLVAGNVNGGQDGNGQGFVTTPDVEGVLTEGATAGAAGTTATLQGSLEPNGFDTHYYFEYGTGESYGATTPLDDAGSATEDARVSATANGLEPNETYDYRLVAENNFGKTTGENVTVRTPIVATVISGRPSASFVEAQSAVLSAAFNPEHFATHYHFEYGPCPTLSGCAGIQSTSEETSSVYGVVGAIQEVKGLSPSTTYRYRLVASNELVLLKGVLRFGGKAVGEEGAFTTAPATSPRVTTGQFSALTPTGAVISGVVNPEGLPGSYAFEIGLYAGASTQYGVVFSGSYGTGSAPVEVTLPLTGLQPGTTYVYRVSISSGYIPGESHILQGLPVAFTTSGLSAALVLPPVLTEVPTPSIAFPKIGSLTMKKARLKQKTKSKKRKKGEGRKGRGKRTGKAKKR